MRDGRDAIPLQGGGMQLSAPEQKAEKEERGSIIIVIVSNAHPIPRYSETKIISLQQLHDGALDLMFEATTEVVGEAIISSLYHGETTTGIRGKTVLSLKEVMR